MPGTAGTLQKGAWQSAGCWCVNRRGECRMHSAGRCFCWAAPEVPVPVVPVPVVPVPVVPVVPVPVVPVPVMPVPEVPYPSLSAPASRRSPQQLLCARQHSTQGLSALYLAVSKLRSSSRIWLASGV